MAKLSSLCRATRKLTCSVVAIKLRAVLRGASGANIFAERERVKGPVIIYQVCNVIAAIYSLLFPLARELPRGPMNDRGNGLKEINCNARVRAQRSTQTLSLCCKPREVSRFVSSRKRFLFFVLVSLPS